MRLQDKVAVITGAASGIGRKSAIRFAAEGAQIVAVDLNAQAGQETVEQVEAGGGEAIFVEADISQGDDCERMVAAAQESFGKVNVLFNNAGIMLGDDGDVENTTESVWEKTLAVNLRGVFLGCKYGIPAIRQAGGGAPGVPGSMAGHAAYVHH